MPTAHTLDSLVWLFFSSLYLAPWLGPVKCFVTWCCECALSNITYPLINYLGLNSNHFLTRWFTAGCTAHHPHERPNCAVMLKVIYSGQMKGLINNGSLLLATPGLPVIICTLAACVHCLLIHRRLTCREGRRRRRRTATAWFTWPTRASSPRQLQRQRWDPRVSHLRWGPEEHDALEDSQGLRARMDGCIHSHKFSAS